MNYKKINYFLLTIIMILKFATYFATLQCLATGYGYEANPIMAPFVEIIPLNMGMLIGGYLLGIYIIHSGEFKKFMFVILLITLPIAILNLINDLIVLNEVIMFIEMMK